MSHATKTDRDFVSVVASEQVMRGPKNNWPQKRAKNAKMFKDENGVYRSFTGLSLLRSLRAFVANVLFQN